MKRAILIVLDSVGAGALPDAAAFHDAGANTLGHIAEKMPLKIPHMRALGLGHLPGISLEADQQGRGAYGRAMEKSMGKDTTTGHWEMAGVILDRPFPTYPNGFPQEVMDAAGTMIEAREGVASVTFVTADEAWDEFKGIYFEERPELAEGFADDNPLADYAHYEVYLNDVTKQADLITFIESLEGVRRVKASQEVADILSNFNMLVGYVSIGVIVMLLCVSIFLISNTVMIGISVRKEEIAIMKLIGATNAFVKAPFLIEGLLIGLIGAAIPLSLLYYLYKELVVYVSTQFTILEGILTFLPVEYVFDTLLPTGIILGVGIGFFGSVFTIRKHLKV